jgi:hypothetical protein
MKEIVISIRENYVIPETFHKIKPEEWEIILNYASEMLLKHDSLSLSDISSDIKTEITSKYESIINDLTKNIYNKESENKELQDRIKNIQDKEEHVILLKLNKQYEHLNKLFNQRLDRELVMINDFHKKELECKNKMLNELETNIERRVIERNEKEKKLLEEYTEKDKTLLKNNFQKEIDELRNNISRYESKEQTLLLELNTEKKSIEDRCKIVIEKAKKATDNELKISLDKHITQSKSDALLFEKEIELRENKIQMLSSELEKAEKHYQDKLQHTKETNQMHELLSDMDKKLNPVIRHYTGSNDEKGQSGENMVRHMLEKSERYEEAIVTDTSSKKHSGDLRFEWKKIKFLIEIKNKNKLCKETDINKFIFDVDNVSKSNESIDCGLFISLQTNIFPGKTHEPLQLDYIGSIPVVYLYLKENDPLLLHCALLLLKKVVMLPKDLSSQEEMLVGYFKNYYDYMISTKKIFEELIDTKKKELRKLGNELELMDRKFSDLDVDYNKIIKIQKINTNNEQEKSDPISESNNKQTTKESDNDIKYNLANTLHYQKKFKQTYIQLACNSQNSTEAKQKTTVANMCTNLNIKNTYLTKIGGYTKLVNDAKIEFLKSLLDDEKINKIVQYKKENNVHPSRECLKTKLNIFTESQIRLLGYVFQNKKLMELICKYCEIINGQDQDQDQDKEQDKENEQSAEKLSIDNGQVEDVEEDEQEEEEQDEQDEDE